MNLKNRVSRIEDGLYAMDSGQTNVVIIHGLSEAEFQSGLARYERLHPLELSDRPGDDIIIIHFRRADPDLQDERM